MLLEVKNSRIRHTVGKYIGRGKNTSKAWRKWTYSDIGAPTLERSDRGRVLNQIIRESDTKNQQKVRNYSTR